MSHFQRLQTATHTYIGRASCGCIHAAVVDCGDKDTAATVAEYIEAELTIERVADDSGWLDQFGRNCDQCKRKEQKELV